MFDSVRKHQRVLLFVVVVLIFPAFAFFGIQGYDQFFSDGDSVAKVNGEAVSRSEFEQAQREQLDRVRQMFGSSIDPQVFDTPAARREILEGLIEQKLLLQHARDMHVVVSDERLRNAISAIPGLQGPDGRFDIERYRAWVAARGRSEQGFESELRRDTALKEMPEAISQSAVVPTVVLDRIVRIVSERREVAEIVFKAENFVDKVQPDDAALKRFYEEQSSFFRDPESASVQYALLDVDALARRQRVSEADIAEFYEQNRKRYGVPEERRARHILIKMNPDASSAERESAQAKARDLLARLNKGARFDELARKESQDPGSARGGGDLEFFTREMMTKAFADAAFGASKGAVVGPVETEFGLHLIEVTDIRPARERTLAEVKKEIEEEIRKSQAGRRFAEDADAFGNLAYEQPDSLQPLVERFGVELQKTEEVTRNGVASLPRDHPLNHPRVLAALFSPDSVNSRRNTEAIDIGAGRVVSARLTDHRPSRLKPYEEVSKEVRQAFVKQESAKLARAAGEARLKALRDGAMREGFSAPREVSRAEQANFAAPAMEAVFKASTAKLPAYVGADLGEQGYGVYEIAKVTSPDDAQVAKRAGELREQVQQMLAQQEVGDFVESLKKRADIKRSLSRLNAGAAQQ
jgi:peptidyl-prolyl cis-trans isomerase D